MNKTINYSPVDEAECSTANHNGIHNVRGSVKRSLLVDFLCGLSHFGVIHTGLYTGQNYQVFLFPRQRYHVRS